MLPHFFARKSSGQEVIKLFHANSTELGISTTHTCKGQMLKYKDFSSFLSLRHCICHANKC